MTRERWIDVAWIDLVGRLTLVRADLSLVHEGPLTVSEADVLRGFGDGESLSPGSVALVPDWSTLRQPTSSGGAGLVLADLHEEDAPSPLCARGFLRRAAAEARADGLEVSAAVELEFFVVDPATGGPIYDWIDNYNLSQRRAEPLLAAIRTRLREAGIAIEASNPEYSGGQFEVNLARSDALRAADDAVLLRHFVRRLAREHGLSATFLAKPWTDQSGSGMHVHQSLWCGDENVFYGGPDALSGDGRAYLAGLLNGLRDLALLGSPTPNGYHRRADGSFAPTTVSWATDNRTTAVRAVLGGASSTRIEHRDAGADANVHLALGAQVLSGMDGMRRGLCPPAPVSGNAYVQDLPQLPRTFLEAFEALEGSELAHRLLPKPLVAAYLEALRPEIEVLVCSTADWERRRYAEISLA